MNIKYANDNIYVINNDKIIILHKNMSIYTNDMINNFDYYFDSVKPEIHNNFLDDSGTFYINDYSQQKEHKVIGFELFNIYFSSLPEPVCSTFQYLEFADLQPGNTVLDLGAYSALSSIIFAEKVKNDGLVIAVEADPINLESCKKNIEKYSNLVKYNNIKLIHGAVWNKTGNMDFSTEGALGSSLVATLGCNRGKLHSVPCYKLSDLVINIDQIDFIKCDIEGAEAYIFNDDLFFEKHKPKIIIEPHYCGSSLNTNTCISHLKKYGYSFNIIEQTGVEIPLLECRP